MPTKCVLGWGSALLMLISAGAMRAQTTIPAQSSAPTAAHAGMDAFHNTLMPEPSSLSVESGSFKLAPSFTVGFTGVHDALLDGAAGRLLAELQSATNLQLGMAPASDASAAAMQIDVREPAAAVQALDSDESYTLEVTPAKIAVRAATVQGGMHAMQTLLQLVQSNPDGYFIPAVHIEDTPRFRWRGLMIDTGRHFQPVPVILRTLDGMAAVKLNVFHWHLTEDQGFRIQSLRFPKLTGMGSDGLFYTQDQAREVIAYARARGIRVVPEFDMPGHTTSWFVGYPELASGPGPYAVERTFGIFDPAIDPTRESTYKFIDAFIGEMAELFPDKYMHIGGDESNGKQWRSNPQIAAFMKAHEIKDTAALQVYFNTRLLKILQRHGKHMVGWDEVFTPGLPKDVVIQSWRGVESLNLAAKAGYQGILSAPYYLDAMKSSETHYLADPIPVGSDLTPEQRKLILGGEVCMWAEHISPETIDSRIWPRTAAMAERFWSPADVRNVPDLYRRLDVMSLRLDALGLQQISGPQRMQRQLIGRFSSPEFTTLASVLQPVVFDQRYQLQHTNQLTPLNQLVDAVVPDPPAEHELAQSVQAFLGDAPHYQVQYDALMRRFREWSETAPTLELEMQQSPRLEPYAARGAELAELGTMGAAAVDYLHAGIAPPSGWEDAQLTRLRTIEAEKILVRFAVLDSVRQLVTSAGGGK